MAARKRLSQQEVAELVTIDRREPNRFITIRFDHLERRGLIRFQEGEPVLTQEGRKALEGWFGGRMR